MTTPAKPIVAKPSTRWCSRSGCGRLAMTGDDYCSAHRAGITRRRNNPKTARMAAPGYVEGAVRTALSVERQSILNRMYELENLTYAERWGSLALWLEQRSGVLA
jgi:hypothetical protein